MVRPILERECSGLIGNALVGHGAHLGAGWTCRAAASRCGNGGASPGEERHDGNTIDGDGCSSGCTSPRCGNGVAELPRGEELDPPSSRSQVVPADDQTCRFNVTRAGLARRAGKNGSGGRDLGARAAGFEVSGEQRLRYRGAQNLFSSAVFLVSKGRHSPQPPVLVMGS